MRKLPLILQSELAECGLACLAMILGFYGYKLNLHDLRKYYAVNLKGMTLLQLMRIAKQLGLTVKVIRLELDQLATINLPCIMHWQMNHFIVVKSIYGDAIEVHDPAQGLRRVSMHEVSQSFTGIVLEVFSKNLVTLPIPLARPIHLFRSLFYKHARSLLKLILFSFIIQIFYITAIRIMQVAIDYSFKLHNYYYLLLLFFLFLSCKIIEISAIALRSALINHVGTLINRQVGTNVMKHLLTLSITFFENRHIGDILSRFTAVEKIRTNLTEGFVETMVDGIVSIIMIAALFYINSIIAIIIILSSSVHCLSRLFYNRRANILNQEALHAKAIELSYFMESLRAILAVKIFHKERERLVGWSNRFIRSLNVATKITWHKIIYDSLKNFIINSELLIVLFICCFFLTKNQISLGSLYALLALRQQFNLALTGLMDKLQEYKLLRIYLDRLQDILIATPEVPKTKKNCSCISHNFKYANLELRNISFHYGLDEASVIKNFNLTVQPGECVVITGASGCGKTTLLKIMMGLLSPTSGDVLIKNISIYPNHITCFRRHLASVLQEDVLLSGSIAENISFFAATPDFLNIIHCAKLAGIHQEIEAFPIGYATLIGDMGSVLSGGQKQRILLARALYVKPKFLFLDEASSHLDIKKEKEVNAALRSLGVTIVMIAHRQETISMADRVITLK